MMITKDFQPLYLVENDGFREFSKALNLRHKIISRKILTNFILFKCYEIAKNNLKNLLQKAKAVPLTIDGWTSNANESYLLLHVTFLKKCQIECQKKCQKRQNVSFPLYCFGCSIN